MAQRLRTAHSTSLDTSEIGNPSTIYAASIAALQSLQWEILHFSPMGILAQTPSDGPSNPSQVRIQLTDERLHLDSRSFMGEVTDMGRNADFVSTLQREIQKVLNERSFEELDQEYLQISQHFDPEDPELFAQPDPEPAWKALMPGKGFVVTPILLLLNLLVYLLMVTQGVHAFEPSGQDLMNWGANFRTLTLGGEWWRLISCCFVHIGLIHLVFNGYALLYIGLLLEPLIGSWKMAVAYLAMGLCSSAASLWFNDYVISAGASGAIFGLYGLFIALALTKLMSVDQRKGILTSMGIFVAYNLLYGLKGGIDNAAHIGGLLSGLIVGGIYYMSLRQADSKTLHIGSMFTSVFVLLGLSAALIAATPNDGLTYEQLIQEFTGLEEEALAATFPQGEWPDPAVLDSVAVPHWERCVEIAGQLVELDLPEQFTANMRKLKRYSELRLQQAEVMHTKFALDTEHFDRQLEGINAQLDSVLQDMGGE